MYEIEFYETEDGKCPIWDFLEALRLKAPTNKDARIQHKQASLYIELLQQNGTHMNAEITKHLDDGIWELRPGNNRVFYFFYQIILMYYFISFERNLKKRLNEKLRKQKQSATTIFAERRLLNYENME